MLIDFDPESSRDLDCDLGTYAKRYWLVHRHEKRTENTISSFAVEVVSTVPVEIVVFRMRDG